MTVNFDTLSGFNYSPYTSALTQPRIGISENALQAGDIGIEALGPKECKTWSSRTYKDRSADSSVSFQSPTRVSPDMAASAVRAHEQEHVSNNSQVAEKNGMKAQSSVAIHTAVCPDCGRIYVSGGTTTTTYSPKEPSLTSSEEGKGYSVNVLV